MVKVTLLKQPYGATEKPEGLMGVALGLVTVSSIIRDHSIDDAIEHANAKLAEEARKRGARFVMGVGYATLETHRTKIAGMESTEISVIVYGDAYK